MEKTWKAQKHQPKWLICFFVSIWFIECDRYIEIFLHIYTYIYHTIRTNQLLLSLWIQYKSIQTTETKLNELYFFFFCRLTVAYAWMNEQQASGTKINIHSSKNNHTFAEWKMENKNKSVEMTVYVHVQSTMYRGIVTPHISYRCFSFMTRKKSWCRYFMALLLCFALDRNILRTFAKLQCKYDLNGRICMKSVFIWKMCLNIQLL